MPSVTPISSPPPAAGITHAPPAEKKAVLPDIAPMRRGRPTAPVQAPTAAKPATNIASADPFAALDSKDYTVRAGAVDELASRFPSIDDFSIALDKGSAFNFPSSAPSQPPAQIGQKVNDRVTNALADEVFATTKPAKPAPPKPEQKASLPSQTASHRNPETTVPSRHPSKRLSGIQQPVPIRPGYASAGTMTSPSPPVTQVKPLPAQPNMPDISKRPIWRVPDNDRSSSHPRASPAAQAAANSLQPGSHISHRPALIDTNRSKSQTATVTLASPASSRPSLEGHRLSQLYTGESVSRARSANSSRPRPVSAAYVDSNLEYLRAQERESAERKRPSLDIRRSNRSSFQGNNEMAVEDGNIENDRDFLRSIEGEKLDRRSSRESSTHRKRASLPAIMNKFGDAFKRFERTKSNDGTAEEPKTAPQRPRTPSPPPQRQDDMPPLSPISGSEATATPPRRVEDMSVYQETEDLPPAMRRELERRRLNAEERRVADAAEEHRNRRAGTMAPPSRANTIQQRVQAFLDEGRQSPKPKKTAEGYGRYTEQEQAEVQQNAMPAVRKAPAPAPPVTRKGVAPQSGPPASEPHQTLSYNKVRQAPQPTSQPTTTVSSPNMAPPPTIVRPVSRPSAPPKPQTLKTGTYQARPPSSQSQAQAQVYQGTGRGPSLAALLARDNEGVAAPGSGMEEETSGGQSRAANTGYSGQADDWEADFSKRYPSLSGIEMVETEISVPTSPEGMPQRRGMRVKDV